VSGMASKASVSVTRTALDRFWSSATGKRPPKNPSDPQVEIREAVVWAMLSAGLIAFVRAVVTKRVADYYERSTSERPR
jgi:Protein of unknown function (DUF4235)